jgi:hypothetical protein
MSAPSRRIAAAFAAALVVSLAVGLVTSASAHRKLYKASISISLNKVPGGDTISGQVTSNGSCVGGRTVSVFEDVNTAVPGDTTQLGTTSTNSSGQWTLAVQGGIKKDRTYFAQVSKRRVKNNRRHKHTCKGATSPTQIGP